MKAFRNNAILLRLKLMEHRRKLPFFLKKEIFDAKAIDAEEHAAPRVGDRERYAGKEARAAKRRDRDRRHVREHEIFCDTERRREDEERRPQDEQRRDGAQRTRRGQDERWRKALTKRLQKRGDVRMIARLDAKHSDPVGERDREIDARPMAIYGDATDLVESNCNRGRARNDEKTGSCERVVTDARRLPGPRIGVRPGELGPVHTCVLARERGSRNKLEHTACACDVAGERRQGQEEDRDDRRGGQGWNMKQNADSRKDRARSAKSQRPSRAA